MVSFLLEQGADVNRRDHYGGYPLSFAASGGDSAIVQQLIDAGSDLNFLTTGGTTLLHFAAFRGLRNLFDLMIERGIDVSVTADGCLLAGPNRDGKTLPGSRGGCQCI